MSDIDAIYSALLRAERKLSEEQDRLSQIHSDGADRAAHSVAASLRALNVLRTEIGAELAARPLPNRP